MLLVRVGSEAQVCSDSCASSASFLALRVEVSYGPLVAMRVGELARRTGVGVSTLRAWERRFQFLEPQRSEAGHRLYNDADVERVNAVVRLVAEGLTLSAAITRVASVGASALPAGEAETLLYSQILQAASQGIWVIFDGRTRFANRRMAELMRCSVDELVTMPIHDIFDPAELPLVKERTEQVRGGQRLHFTQRLHRADGSTFLAEVNTTPLFNQAGRYQGSVAMVSDVTARDHADRDREARDRQAETLALLGLQAIRDRADRHGGAAVIRTKVVEATRRLLDADRALVLDMIGDTGELQVGAASPPVDERIAVPAGSRSFAGYIALARKVVIVDNAELDRRFDAGSTEPDRPIAAAIGAPILGPHGVVGVLIAESATPDHFDHGDVHFIQCMANIIGTAQLNEQPDPT